MCRASLFFKSLAHYIRRDMRDIGEVPSHKLEFLRSLTIDVEMFPYLVHDFEKKFVIPLRQLKSSIHSFCQ